MTRRTLLKLFPLVFGAVLPTATAAPVPPPAGVRYFRDVRVGAEFTQGGGKWRYRRIPDREAGQWPVKGHVNYVEIGGRFDGREGGMGPFVPVD